ncbi:MAG: helix-turn-helix domain-containing protein [Tissierellia bacterium]|nr:helix-turn-helix domain-containing protein [Tissierellia bacterium]
MKRVERFTLAGKPQQRPYHVYIQKVKGYVFDSHPGVEIIYMLQGKMNVETSRGVKECSGGDIVIINSYECHSICSDDPDHLMLVVQINSEELGENGADLLRVFFDESVGESSNIKLIIEAISAMAYLSWGEEDLRLKEDEQVLVKRLANTLLNYFRSDEGYEKRFPTGDVHDKILEIMDSLKEDIVEPVTLQTVADDYEISLSYLSRIFTKVTGIGLPEFVRRLRLTKAVDLLQNTSITILDVATKSGFPSIKVMGQTFRAIVGRTPSQTRKKLLKFKHASDVGALDYYSLPSVNEMLKEGQQAYTMIVGNKSIVVESINVESNVHLVKGKIDKPWKNVLTTEVLGYQWKERLNSTQQELDFKLFKLTVSYGENGFYLLGRYGVYREIELVEIRQIIARIEQIGWIPVISFDLMETTLNHYFSMSINDMLKEIKDHFNMFMDYMLNTVGLRRMKTWNYEISVKTFSAHNAAAFHKGIAFFHELCRSLIEKMEGQANWGVFLGIIDTNNIKYLSNRFKSLIVNNKLPMVIGFDLLLDWGEKVTNEGDKVMEDLVSKNDLLDIIYSGMEDARRDDHIIYISRIHGILDESLINNTYLDMSVPIRYIDTAPLKETPYIFGNYSTIYAPEDKEDLLDPTIKATPRWTSEIINNNGIKTPSYYMFEFLNNLGGELLIRKEGCIITKEEEDYQIIVYNKPETYDKSKDKNKKKSFRIGLVGIEGRYNITTQEIGLSRGNVRQTIEDIGGPEFLSDFEVEYLKGVVRPKLNVETSQLDGIFEREMELEPCAIVQIIMTKA